MCSVARKGGEAPSRAMDAIDRALIDHLQEGIDVCAYPFAAPASALDLTEDELIGRLRRLVSEGILSRFGPLFDAERLGGGVTLVAMQVPPEDFERVAAIVNAKPEVAHNYARAHTFNMWFVIATETPEQVETVIADIERSTGRHTLVLPRHATFHLGLRFKA